MSTTATLILRPFNHRADVSVAAAPCGTDVRVQSKGVRETALCPILRRRSGGIVQGTRFVPAEGANGGKEERGVCGVDARTRAELHRARPTLLTSCGCFTQQSIKAPGALKVNEDDLAAQKVATRNGARTVQHPPTSAAPPQGHPVVAAGAPPRVPPPTAVHNERRDVGDGGGKHGETQGCGKGRDTAAERRLSDAVGIVLKFMAAVPPANTARTNESTPYADMFRSTSVPKMSIGDYFDRIRQTFDITPECYVLALIYIDRLVGLYPGLSVDAYSIHRLFLVGMVAGVKYHDDDHQPNGDYAYVGGLSPQALNALERHFLEMLQWRLHVEEDEFTKYKDMILLAVPKSGNKGE